MSGFFKCDNDMSPEDKDEWLKSFYGQRIHRKLVIHACTQAAALLVITTAELAAALAWGVFDTDAYQAGNMGTFLATRILLCIGLLLWAALGRWTIDHPRIAELGRMFEICAAVVLLTSSYCALMPNYTMPDAISESRIKIIVEDAPYRLSVWTLMIVLSYGFVVVMMSLRLRSAAIVILFSNGYIHWALDRTRLSGSIRHCCYLWAERHWVGASSKG
jgi:hypothetical protein